MWVFRPSEKFALLLPEANFGLRVLSSPASVCLSVCVCVCVSITCLSARYPVTNSSWDHQIWTRDAKHLGLYPYCFEGRSTLTFKIKFDLKVPIYPIWACPHHTSSSLKAGITEFGPVVQNSFVKFPIVSGIDLCWSSYQFWILKP